MNYTEQIFELLFNEGCLSKSKFGKLSTVTKRDVENVFDYVPEENRKKFLHHISMRKVKDRTFNALLSEAAKDGVLSFNPYIATNKNGIPVLVLRYNKFLMLSDGTSFVVTYSSNGSVTYQQPSTNLSSIERLFKKSLMDHNLFQTLAYMNLIEAGKGIGVFDKLLKSNSTLVDEFFRKSYEYQYGHLPSVTYDNLISFCVKQIESPKLDNNKCFRLPVTDTSDLCRIYLAPDYDIYVEVLHNNYPTFFRFTLPDIPVIEKHLYEFEMGPEEFEDYTIDNIYNDCNVKLQFITFALNTLDIIINYNVFYRIDREDETLRRLNKNNITTVTNLETFYDYFTGKVNIEDHPLFKEFLDYINSRMV